MVLTIHPTDATLGATLTGVDLSALTNAQWREIELALSLIHI